MSFDIDSLDGDYCAEFAGWLKDTGLWDGRHVTLEEAPTFQKTLEARLSELIHSMDPDSSEFERLGITLAALGVAPENRAMLACDIRALHLIPEWRVIPAGFCKSVCQFWQKYKVEILIGTGFLVVGGGLAIAYYCYGGAAAAVTTAGIALSSFDQDDKPQVVLPTQPTSPPKQIQDSSPELTFPGKPVCPSFNQTHYEYLKKIEPEKRFPQTFQTGQSLPLVMPYSSREQYFKTGLEVMEPSPGILKMTGPHDQNQSIIQSIPTRFQIGGINGMATSFDQAVDHCNYISQFMGDNRLEWVYNKTNSTPIDALEIVFNNYYGVSGKTGAALEENWTRFHRENSANPDIKYLQFCHSQGAIHVRNALENVPVEIQQRVIVVGVAPAAIVPNELCYKSYNYASRNDPVPRGEIYFEAFFDSNESNTSARIDKVFEYRKELIILEPHPDATGIDHEFQSPTFYEIIKYHINIYLDSGGAYK